MTWTDITNVAFEYFDKIQVNVCAFTLHSLNVPEFTAVTLLMGPVSRVGLHVLVNLNCYVFCEWVG
jgi:hypothetical protein